MAKILLSYRRLDSAGITGRIFDRLVSRYGTDSVFMDVDNIPLGIDFREHIKETLVASDVLLAIVGPRWLARREDGQSRIKQPTDPVRIEIETALQARVPVIPVLVDGAPMPDPTDLPDTLERFCYLNAATVESGREFHHQLDRLIRSLDQIIAANQAATAKTAADRAAAEKAAAEQAAAVARREAAAGQAAVALEPAATAAPAPRAERADEPPPEALAVSQPIAQRGLGRRLILSAAAGAVVGGAAFLTVYGPQRAPQAEQPPPRPPESPPPVSPPPRTIAEVAFGIGGPMTQSNAAFGAQLKNGAEQAIADINEVGGILGKKISSSVGDDAADPKQGVSVANKFVSDDVKFVIGHFNSGVTMPASEIYQENGILEITPGSTNPRVTERNMWNIFRTCGRDDQQGLVAGEYIAKNFRGKKIAIVHDKTVYGQGLAEITKRTINARGIRESLYEGVNYGDKDFSALITRTRASGADLVYWGGLHTEGGLIVRQMRGAGVRATLMGGDGITSDEFATIGGPGVEGTLMTYGPDPRKRPEARAIVEKFRAKNFEPESYTLYSYAAVQIIKQAAEAANSLDPKKVAEKMSSGMNFKTVIGDISYDKKGDITRLDYVMYVWKKAPSGKLSYVEIGQ